MYMRIYIYIYIALSTSLSLSLLYIYIYIYNMHVCICLSIYLQGPGLPGRRRGEVRGRLAGHAKPAHLAHNTIQHNILSYDIM